ncbi:hypothetical protein [uncultured Arcticibacterium sp.]|uniref:hypothetical protein n=1 Tax=uncultured Arcticibacterium sp. TaxID=2173042 RepID=UPI0030F671D9
MFKNTIAFIFCLVISFQVSYSQETSFASFIDSDSLFVKRLSNSYFFVVNGDKKLLTLKESKKEESEIYFGTKLRIKIGRCDFGESSFFILDSLNNKLGFISYFEPSFYLSYLDKYYEIKKVKGGWEVEEVLEIIEQFDLREKGMLGSEEDHSINVEFDKQQIKFLSPDIPIEIIPIVLKVHVVYYRMVRKEMFINSLISGFGATLWMP